MTLEPVTVVERKTWMCHCAAANNTHALAAGVYFVNRDFAADADYTVFE